MKRPDKIYTLDDGSKVTIKDIIKKTGLKESTIRYRLTHSKSPKKLYAKLQKHRATRYFIKDKEIITEDYVQYIKDTKPYYNKLFRLMLKAI
jgi:hypothetical protein